MKLISLNIWGGREFNALLSFLTSHAESTDIFCFQETFSFPKPLVSRGARLNIFQEFEKILPLHQSFFFPTQDKIDEQGATTIPSQYGQSLFVKKSLRVEKTDFVFAYRGRNSMKGDDFGTLGCGFAYAQLNIKKNPLTVVNVHGICEPGNKLDTPERLIQSQKIKDFLDGVTGAKIFCGDFNLMPETESIKMLEKNMKNLIREFNIPETRGEISHRRFPKDPQHFADYAFVSPEIKIVSFQVPNVSISDHLPLILEFSL